MPIATDGNPAIKISSRTVIRAQTVFSTWETFSPAGFRRVPHNAVVEPRTVVSRWDLLAGDRETGAATVAQLATDSLELTTLKRVLSGFVRGSARSMTGTVAVASSNSIVVASLCAVVLSFFLLFFRSFFLIYQGSAFVRVLIFVVSWDGLAVVCGFVRPNVGLLPPKWRVSMPPAIVISRF